MVADALSRRPGLDEHPVTFSSLSTCQPLLIQQLQDFYSTHDVGQALITKSADPPPMKPSLFAKVSFISKGVYLCQLRLTFGPS